MVERTNIAIIGKTNAGKSSLINLLSGQKDFAIVDPTPGTTSDNVVTLMEIHSLGPVKIIDTAGINEESDLGEKKRKKAFIALEESDLCLLTFDFYELIKTNNFEIEKELLDYTLNKNKQVLLIFNLIKDKANIGESQIEHYRKRFETELDVPSLCLDIADFTEQSKLIQFILSNFKFPNKNFDIFPKLSSKGMVLLNIPMDEETPELRLLRPQEIVVERLLRNFTIPVLYRMDLKSARSKDEVSQNIEKERFINLINNLKNSMEGLQFVITDSQAFDVVGKWLPKDITLTSFSIAMTNFMTYGNIDYLRDSTYKIDKLKEEDLILIAEACNHNRQCDDIGTVQLPRLIQNLTNKKFRFEFSFGRTFPDDLQKYQMIIHCGSCMTDRQKYYRRLEMAISQNIPFTNYGMVLSYCQNKELLLRALEPFNVGI